MGLVNGDRPLRIHFLLVRRDPPVPSPMLLEVERLLRHRGFEVSGDIAEETLRRSDTLGAFHDLYLLKSHTDLALSVAGILHDRGARILNPYPACAAAQNKIRASNRLRKAGVPAPATWVTADFDLLRSIVEKGPVIVKPYQGHRGAGISVIRDPDELSALAQLREPHVVQEYIEGPGEDLKIYVVDRDVFAVRKKFSPRSFSVPGVPCDVDEEVRSVALRTGAAFGLTLYGLDIIAGPDGPMVVDVNYFPGYKGVPGVAPLIADHIAQAAAGNAQLRSGQRASSNDVPAMDSAPLPAASTR